jgi:TolB-like protein/Tfp pilus assembly protein PilF
MPDNSNKLSQFWQELKRRKVVRVITVYAAAAFVILELVDIITEPFGLPDWTLKLVVVLLSIGFVVSIFLSWFYDFNTEGELEKTKPVQLVKKEDKAVSSSTWKIASYISFAVIIGLITFHFVSANNRSEKIAILEKSIAVLPFENMSDDESNAHLGGAFTDEIIIELQKIKTFDRVLSRTSTMQYDENRPTIPEIAEKLNVNYIIEGSIQRHEEEVRVRVQVIRANQEDHIWAEVYNGKWKDIFSIQDEIAYKVANELKTVLSKEEIEQIDQQQTDNPEAYDMYLKGRYFWNKRTESGTKDAIEYFSEAIAKDSNYALAFAGLADAYIVLAIYEWFLPYQESYLKAKEIALDALKIDPNLAEACTSLALVKLHYEWDWSGASINFNKAIELNPDHETAHHWYSLHLTAVGLHDEAIAEAKHAQKLNPFSPIIVRNVGRRLYFARMYDQALDESLKALTITPDFFPTYWTLSLIYLQKEMFSEAILEMQKAVEYSGDSFLIKSLLGYVYGATDNQAKAQVILDSLLSKSKEGTVPAIAFANIYIGLGENDNAIHWLEKAYDERSSELINLNASPIFDPLRSEPRFQDLVDQMNFPDY